MPRLATAFLCALLLAPLTPHPIAIAHQTAACQPEPGTPPAATPATPASPAATPATDVPPRTVQVRERDALLWGGGDHAVLLVHGAAYDAASWEPQAQAIASQGFLVLALEEIASDDVLAGIAYLTADCGAAGVALIGASAGASAALTALASGPAGVDGLILLSGTGDVSGLGPYPKLFVASEGEGIADTVETMATDAPGDDNEALIFPGDAHAQAIFGTDQGDPLLDAIIAQLERDR